MKISSGLAAGTHDFQPIDNSRSSRNIYIYMHVYGKGAEENIRNGAREDGNRKINVLHIRSIRSANANGKTPRLRAESIKTATAKHSK